MTRLNIGPRLIVRGIGFMTTQSAMLMLLVVLGMLLVGCSDTSLETPEDTALPPSPAVTSTPTVRLETAIPTPTFVFPDASVGLIALISNDQLWVMEPNGQSREQLTTKGKASAPAWSPDGQTLAYVYQEGEGEPKHAVLHQLDSGKSTALTTDVWRLHTIVWSPNGRYLHLAGGSDIAHSLTVIDVMTSEDAHTLGAVGNSPWSPDGERIALGRIHPLETLISVGGGDSVDLAVIEIGQEQPRVVLEGSSEVLFFPHEWLPDGRLLYDRLDWDEEAQDGEYSSWTINLDDGIGTPQPADDIPPKYDWEATKSGLPEEFQDISMGHFSWSSDEHWLVFHAGFWADTGVYIYRWGSDGQAFRLTDGFSPVWQPVPTGN